MTIAAAPMDTEAPSANPPPSANPSPPQQPKLRRKRTSSPTFRSKPPITPIPQWEGLSAGDLIERARFHNKITLREAGEIAGIPYTNFAYTRVQARPHTTAMNRAYAKIGIPYELLELRSGRLPAHSPIEFQDMVYRLWLQYQEELAARPKPRVRKIKSPKEGG